MILLLFYLTYQTTLVYVNLYWKKKGLSSGMQFGCMVTYEEAQNAYVQKPICGHKSLLVVFFYHADSSPHHRHAAGSHAKYMERSVELTSLLRAC
jgi:hypothetical protein